MKLERTDDPNVVVEIPDKLVVRRALSKMHRILVRGAELGRLIGVGPYTVTKWANKGYIRGYKVDKATLYDPYEVLADIKRHFRVGGKRCPTCKR